MADGTEIVASGVWKSFDAGLVKALCGVDLRVDAGERVAIMGPTGCGKSTLLSILALLDEADRGDVLLDGRPAATLGPAEEWRRSNLGIVFQLHHLLPHLTVEENVLLPFAGREARSGGRERAAALLAELELGHRARTFAAKLSGGERQLAAVARALVNNPRLVLADEPTGSVDSATGDRILSALFDWSRSRAATLVVVTHDPRVAALMERTVHMRDGRTVDAGPAVPPKTGPSSSPS